MDNAGKARLIALVVPAGLLGGALFSQYVGGLNPCEMCYLPLWPEIIGTLWISGKLAW